MATRGCHPGGGQLCKKVAEKSQLRVVAEKSRVAVCDVALARLIVMFY